MVGNMLQVSSGHIQCFHLETQQPRAGCSVVSVDAIATPYLSAATSLCLPVMSSTRKCGILFNMDAVPYFSISVV